MHDVGVDALGLHGAKRSNAHVEPQMLESYATRLEFGDELGRKMEPSRRRSNRTPALRIDRLISLRICRLVFGIAMGLALLHDIGRQRQLPNAIEYLNNRLFALELDFTKRFARLSIAI